MFRHLILITCVPFAFFIKRIGQNEKPMLEGFCLNIVKKPFCLMVSALDSRSSGPGSNPDRDIVFLFLGKTLYSHSASLHPGV